MRQCGWRILTGFLLLAASAWPQGTTTTSTSAFTLETINTTHVTQQVNAFQVELKARMQGGSYLFDQTYGAALSSPTVQAAITQAKNLLTSHGAVSFGGPTLLAAINPPPQRQVPCRTG